MKNLHKLLILLLPLLILSCSGRKNVPEAEDRVVRALEESYAEFDTIVAGVQAYNELRAGPGNLGGISGGKWGKMKASEFVAETKRLKSIMDRGSAAQKRVASHFKSIRDWINTEWTGDDATKAQILSIVNQDVSDDGFALRRSTIAEIREILELYGVSPDA